jgi:hypothetical protein
LGEVRALARQSGPDAIRELREIMLDRRNQVQARIAAAEVLLDRGYGKPRQDIGIDLPGQLTTSLEDAATGMVDLVRAFGLLGKLDPDLQAMIEARPGPVPAPILLEVQPPAGSSAAPAQVQVDGETGAAPVQVQVDPAPAQVQSDAAPEPGAMRFNMAGFQGAIEARRMREKMRRMRKAEKRAIALKAIRDKQERERAQAQATTRTAPAPAPEREQDQAATDAGRDG